MKTLFCDCSLNKSRSVLSGSKQFWVIYQNENELNMLIHLVNNGSNVKLSFSVMFKSVPIIWVGHSWESLAQKPMSFVKMA